jgi:hypothetical protein
MQNAEEAMIPEALNKLNRSEEYLKGRRTKKKHSNGERNNQMTKKGRKAQQDK